MRSLVNIKTDEDIARALIEVRDRIRDNYPDAEVILYGSFARGQADPESDVDVLVLLGKDVNADEKKKIHDQIYDVGLENDIVFSSLITSKNTWNQETNKFVPFYQNVIKDGILVA